METPKKSELYGSFVWIFSSIVIFTYISFALLGGKLPGVEQLLDFISGINEEYIYVAAFLSVFIEGLYFIGSVFPGTTLIVLIAILSQTGGVAIFAITILSIFIGWSLASIVNIFFARVYKTKVLAQQQDDDFEVKDRLFVTWLPVFRANYEVAQVSQGGRPLKVFFSSLRVKFFACTAATIGIIILAMIIDVNTLSNEEGFATLAIVALISLTVGVTKARSYYVALKNNEASRVRVESPSD